MGKMLRLLIAAVLAQSFVRMAPGNTEPEPYFCGRKCNCGQGQTHEFVTKEGKLTSGIIAPPNYECTCGELYLCDPSKEGVPNEVVKGKCAPPQGMIWNGMGGTVIR